MSKMMFAMILVLSLTMSGAQLAKVTMPDEIEIEGQKLVLNGMALREKVIFKVYVDALYLLRKESSAETILQKDEPRHNVLHFLRSVGKGKLNDAWLDGLEANTPKADKALRDQFTQLTGLMEDMKDGQVMSFTYLPGIGTRVTVKGQLKGTIEGKPFADALFACWIGAKPGPGQKFKKGLLGL